MKYTTNEVRSGLEFHIIGDFIYNDHDEFLEIVKKIKKAEYEKMYLNFSECNFLDSAAMGMLVIASDAANECGVKLAIKGAKDRVKRVLYAARFDTIFNIEE